MPLLLRPFRWSAAGLAAALLFCGLTSAVWGQAIDPKTKIPPPEDVDLKDKNGRPLTKDGMLIKATYYGGLRKEKTVPIIILHGWKGNRTEFAELATFLQTEKGHAVLVPDLRGHGDSTKVEGSTRPLEAAKLRPDDFEAMLMDVEACKQYLREKNNAEQLNIDKLCLIGSEMGAVLAMNWAISDWSYRQLPGVPAKQGQDVKALVLLSPQYQMEKGSLNMAAALKSDIQKNFSVAILYGGTAAKKYGSDAERIKSQLSRFHPESSEEQTFFFDELKTSLQGSKMLAAPGLPVKDLIAAFIELRLVEKEIPWRKRPGVFDN